MRGHEPRIQNLQQFHSHTVLHIRRVEILGLEIQRLFFPTVETQILQQFLRQHDKVKITDWRAPNSVMRRLFRFFGQGATDVRLIEWMRTYETLAARDFFLARGYYERGIGFSIMAKDILLIEKIADLIDRGLDPIASQEFGGKLQIASEYLKLDEVHMRIVRFIESQYHALTGPLAYPGTLGCNHLLEGR